MYYNFVGIHYLDFQTILIIIISSGLFIKKIWNIYNTFYLFYIPLYKVIIIIVIVHYSNSNFYLLVRKSLILSLLSEYYYIVNTKVISLKLIFKRRQVWVENTSFNFDVGICTSNIYIVYTYYMVKEQILVKLTFHRLPSINI